MARLRKLGKSGNYFAYFYDSNRSPKEKSYPLRTTRKDIARRRLTKLEDEYADGKFDPWTDDEPVGAFTLEEAIERFLKDKRGSVRKSAVEQYDSKLGHFRRRYVPGGCPCAT